MSYEPGVCNIGKRERTKRRQYGIVSAALAVVYLGLVWYLALPDGYVLGTGIFIYGAVLNEYQARRSFCVALAVQGIQDFTGSGGSRETITRSTYRNRDRQAAYKLGGYAILVSAGMTLLVYTVFRLIT